MKRRQFFIVIVVCFMLTILHILDTDFVINESDTSNEGQKDTGVMMKNIDEEKILLEKAKEKNSDIYGWISVEGTKINYPIVQHENNDLYYLNHDSEKNKTIYGAIFTEKYNSRNFEDKITLIYGHAMKDGSMFGSLRDFRDGDFFSKNKYIKIYFKDMIYTYEIVSSYTIDNEHIFSKYDLTSEEKILKYYQDIERKAKEKDGNFRKVDIKNNHLKMIALSTCNSSYDNDRYIIHAVFKKGEKLE